MTAPHVITFGCRLNAYESAVIEDLASRAKLDDAVIVNTCAVTAEAERQARQAIRRARRERPDAQIVVTGCAAQIDPAKYAVMPEVDRVLGNEEKMRAESYARDDAILVGDIMTVRETASHLVEGFDGRARAFLEIQQGCDHRCTFCIIPFGRGNNRSVPIGRIVEQARALVESGYREIVLTGVDVTGYGGDLPGRPTLGQMVRRLLALVPDLERLRLTSLDPVEIDDDLLDLFATEPRLMPHAHLSVQAGADVILKRMKRRHLSADVIEICRRLRSARPDIVFGADLIAGFPTETEVMFAETLDLIDVADLTFLHVFPYSARPGTPAARMPQIPARERKARAARLRATGAMRVARFLSGRVGAVEDILVEQPALGRTAHYASIVLDRQAAPGTTRRARVTGADERTLSGRLFS